MRTRRQQILAARPPRPSAQSPGRSLRPQRQPTPLPWDSAAQRESSELGNQAADTRASLANRFQRQQEEIGLGEASDNPYSHAAQLARERDNAQRAVTTTAGSNLYAGSTVNAQRQVLGQYDEGLKRLEGSYDQAKADYEGGTQRTQRDYQQGLAAIREGALRRFLQTEPTPIAPGGHRVQRPRRRR